MEKSEFVELCDGEESREALLLTITGCFCSMANIVWYGYCSSIFDDLIKHNQARLPLSIF